MDAKQPAQVAFELKAVSPLASHPLSAGMIG